MNPIVVEIRQNLIEGLLRIRESDDYRVLQELDIRFSPTWNTTSLPSSEHVELLDRAYQRVYTRIVNLVSDCIWRAREELEVDHAEAVTAVIIHETLRQLPHLAYTFAFQQWREIIADADAMADQASFEHWLEDQEERFDEVGRFARFVKAVEDWPFGADDLRVYRDHLVSMGHDEAILDDLREAWNEYVSHRLGLPDVTMTLEVFREMSSAYDEVRLQQQRVEFAVSNDDPPGIRLLAKLPAPQMALAAWCLDRYQQRGREYAGALAVRFLAILTFIESNLLHLASEGLVAPQADDAPLPDELQAFLIGDALLLALLESPYMHLGDPEQGDLPEFDYDLIASEAAARRVLQGSAPDPSPDETPLGG